MRKMARDIPTWLTKDFIKTALQHDKDLKDILSIERMEIDTPVPEGNNASCVIFRVQAIYKVKNDQNLHTISLIIKAPTKSEIHEFISEKGVYKKESSIYNELIPKYKSVLGDKWPDIMAKSFFSTEEGVMILEDLKVKGYVMADRVKQLNFEECATALSSLAIFHAASVKLYETEPELIKKVGKEPFFCSELKDSLNGFVKGIIGKIANECENRLELKKYAPSVRIIGECSFDFVQELCKPKEGEFNVLNHGDFWTTNMMFKYLNNKPVHVIPIDFQICRYATPAIDIVYFMNGSAKEEVKVEKYDDLLNIYLDKLNTHLQIFGSKERLKKSELTKAIDNCGIFAVFSTVFTLPLIIIDQKLMEIKDMTLEELKTIHDNSSEDVYLKNEKYLKILIKRFEEFEKKGWFLKKQ
ncbi:uncharacterized protein LOC142319374 [Lycorma delicatula]|uniref:uncharacterized protein LOC142319371 n=1 Tax=Lycorma delicatula TaxID=130591 RepID=UPI003F50DB5F